MFVFFACCIYGFISAILFIANRKMYYKYGLSRDKAQRWYFTFIYVFYLEMLIYGMINLENDELINLPSNWSLSGNLKFAEQFSIVLGIIFYYALLCLPVLILNAAK